MGPKIEIKKRWFRSPVVIYPCASCDSSLRSPVDEIGITDYCPNCQFEFVVPGKVEYAEFLRNEKIEEENRLKAEAKQKAEAERRRQEELERAQQHRAVQIREARIREETEKNRKENEEQAQIDRMKNIEGSPYWFIEKAAKILDAFSPRTSDFHWQFNLTWGSAKEARLLKKQLAFAKKGLSFVKRELNEKKKSIRSDASMQRMMIGNTDQDFLWNLLLTRRSRGYINQMKRMELSQQVRQIVSTYDEAGRIIDQFKNQLDALALQIDHWLLNN